MHLKWLKSKSATSLIKRFLNFYTILYQDAVPFAVVGSNSIMEIRSKKVRGRQYPWGVVEVENPDHCDFVKLRTMLM